MKRKSSSFGLNRAARCSQLLSYLLLAIIAYSSTAEAVHKHGNSLRASATASANCLSNQGGTTTSSNGATQSGDCVVCHFQQNLSSAALFAPVLALAPQESHSVVALAILSVSSTGASPQQGRAPPLTF